MIQMIYNDTSDRSGCQRKRAASEILMMTSSVMPRGVCEFVSETQLNLKRFTEPFDSRKRIMLMCEYFS